MDASNNVVVTVSLRYSTNINTIGVYCLIYEKPYLSTQYSINLDSGYVSWDNSVSSASFALPNPKTTSYISGYNSLGSQVEDSAYVWNEFYNERLVTQSGYFF